MRRGRTLAGPPYLRTAGGAHLRVISLDLRPIHLQPLPYSFQKTLPDLGRGGPWVSHLLLENRAARCAAPTTFFATSKSGASRRPRPTAQHQPSPARQSQAPMWNRTSFNFWKARARWPGLNLGKPLRFCAPEILQNLANTRPPVMGVLGDGRHGGRGGAAASADCARPLAVLW